MDDAIDGLIASTTISSCEAADKEHKRWRRSEPCAEKGTQHANDPIKYELTLRDRYPNLSRLVLDVVSIPASNCECECMFGELGDLLEPRRRGIRPQLLAAI
jgi:hypothetical protein